MNIGYWTNKEKKLYYKYILICQINNTNQFNWTKLATIIKTRTGKQIRSFHQKEYQKILKDSKLLFNLRYYES